MGVFWAGGAPGSSTGDSVFDLIQSDNNSCGRVFGNWKPAWNSVQFEIEVKRKY